ncbi:MAG: ATP-binding protein [Thermoflexales bacterium]|nr:ATP-binding protein [Thermoflexales bacterium]
MEIHIPSEYGYEKVAMASAAAVAKRMGFSPDRIDDLKTAVAEACLNALEHGNELDVSTKVMIVMTAQESGLEVHVTDAGKQPMPNTLPQPSDQPGERHRGIFIIKHLMDEVEFSSMPTGGNQIRMVIHMNKPSS